MTSVVEHDTSDQFSPATSPAPEATSEPAGRDGDGRAARSRVPALRTFLATAALVACAAAGGTYVVTQRLADAAFVSLEDAVLTADALPVGSTGAGVVTEVLVTEQARVAAGQELARVRLAEDPAQATRGPRTETLKAPMPGTVSRIDIAVGGVAGAGEPIITMYDHTELSFEAKATEEQLRDLRLGMAARVTGPGLGRPVSATLDHVKPRVGADPLLDAPLTEEQKVAHERLTVVLVPGTGDVDAVSALVPGLRYTAEVDTRTAVGRIPAVNSAG
ncbi:HlyD family efflux transporter periplasmic adaptor subunit [Actinoplanes sp. NEAU-A12]|uniref:HlyD family efflux transporter periplasmic adaptor subunit n=1 Tax=Actinoplanes sandaracinus TaxID=3045177 RepID=A0ABT6WWT5_9ACTN|nr:HlyD family efflux transporter periplasmic adaptor subunit [Actinoplanes sandaracinus]MDI6104189.1 HlyD family efflux transporter periplasmic adaptor subunit [Actinoplanes sandaracinus]